MCSSLQTKEKRVTMLAIHCADSAIPSKTVQRHASVHVKKLRAATGNTLLIVAFFGITWVALLPRQRLLEKTRLPSTVQLCFCSNQGYWEGCGFAPLSLKQSLPLQCVAPRSRRVHVVPRRQCRKDTDVHQQPPTSSSSRDICRYTFISFMYRRHGCIIRIMSFNSFACSIFLYVMNSRWADIY